jgi:hypothetical protein
MGTLRLIQGGPTGGGGDEGERPDEQLPAASMIAPAVALAADPDADEKTLVAPSVSAIDLRLLRRAPRPPADSVKVPMPAAPPSRSVRAGTPPIESPERMAMDTDDASVDIDADTTFFDDGADVAGAPAEPFANMPSDSGIGALDSEADETAGLDTAPAARSGAADLAAPSPPRFDPIDAIAPRVYRRAQSPHPLPLAAPPSPSPAPVSEDVSIDPAAYAAVAYKPAAPRTSSTPHAGPFTASISALAPAPALLPALSIAARSTTHLVCALLAAVALGFLLGWLLFG